MKRPRIALIFAFIFLIGLRRIFENSDQLVTIVGMINTIALLVVVHDVGEKVKSQIIEKIERECKAKKIAERETRKFVKIFYLCIIAASAAFVIVYFRCAGCSGLRNDIISIVALGLSILDDEVAMFAVATYKV